MSLIRNNARVGSLIACELAKIRQYLPEGHQQEIGHGGVDLRGQRSPIKSSHSVAAETVKKTELKKQPVSQDCCLLFETREYCGLLSFHVPQFLRVFISRPFAVFLNSRI